MSKIHPNPDGSVSFNDERYRVKERDKDHYDVVRERDGAVVGAFRLLSGLQIEAEGEHREIVEAVAGVLSAPHGPLPFQ
jgi:hypothetical protein